MELELLSINAFSDPLAGAYIRRAVKEWGVVLIIGCIIYFLPTIIAFKRGKRNKVAIFALNLLLGWTFIGWAISLVWSLTVDEGVRG